MLKFFRNIRQQLLSENRFSKYLLYAIGEIILVVIGILIALQINNWNETRRNTEISKALLEEFKKDLERDTLEANYVINKLEKQLELESWSLRLISYGPDQVDSLRQVFLGTYYQLPISTRTYDKLQNSENPNLTGFPDLQNEIRMYYTEIKYLVDSYNEEEIYYALESDINQVIRSKLEIKLADFPMLPQNDPADNFIDFAQGIEGRNFVKENFIRRRGMKEYLIYVKEEAIRLHQLIDEMLDSEIPG